MDRPTKDSGGYWLIGITAIAALAHAVQSLLGWLMPG